MDVFVRRNVEYGFGYGSHGSESAQERSINILLSIVLLLSYSHCYCYVVAADLSLHCRPVLPISMLPMALALLASQALSASADPYLSMTMKKELIARTVSAI